MQEGILDFFIYEITNNKAYSDRVKAAKNVHLVAISIEKEEIINKLIPFLIEKHVQFDMEAIFEISDSLSTIVANQEYDDKVIEGIINFATNLLQIEEQFIQTRVSNFAIKIKT